MALDASRLKDKILEAINEETDRDTAWQKICEKIIEEIRNNAEITGIQVSTAGLVTTCPAGAGTVTSPTAPQVEGTGKIR